MTSEPRPILAEYVRAGWALVPIPLGQKGPMTSGWSRRELCITEPEVAEWLDGNVGLAHAYSGTAAVDIDDLAKATTWLAEQGVDLTALLTAPDAVRIESRPGRAKLLYRMARPLPSFKVGPVTISASGKKSRAIELRCGTSNNLTVQDVLPPSIHPDTGAPYTWRYGSPDGHWSKLPPLPAKIALLWTSLVAPQPTKPVPRKETSETAARLRELLAPQDPDAPYDDWLAVGMALHHETQGAPAGLALWNEWSSRGKKYKGIGDLETHWRSFRLDHNNPRTLASLRIERPASPDEFPDLTKAPGKQLAPLSARREIADAAIRGLKRNKGLLIEARISNICTFLSFPEVCNVRLALDEFLDAIVIAPEGTEEWRPLNDNDYTNMRCWLETKGNCEPIPHDMMRQAVHLVAEQQRTDSARNWLEGLTWDGKPRVADFCPRYFGTSAGQYERAVGLYLWTALAGRIMRPGCQADMVPVLIGRQGVGKSRGVQAIAPDMEQYAEVRVDEPDDVIARKMRGCVIGEMAEMRGLRAAEVERVKAFITRTHERWVPKYKEFATNYPRRFIIVGTTNDEEFLPTDTEHRRWLPMHTNAVAVPDIVRDRDQLWAEALVLWSAGGVAWRGLDQLAAPARQEAAGVDNWHELIATWLGNNPADYHKMADVLTNAVGMDPRTVTRVHELRVGRILRALGYVRTTVRDGNKVLKAWVFDPAA